MFKIQINDPISTIEFSKKNLFFFFYLLHSLSGYKIYIYQAKSKGPLHAASHSQGLSLCLTISVRINVW